MTSSKHQSKEGGIAILITDKINLKEKSIIKSHNRMLKGSIYQEDTLTLNLYVPNTTSTEYIN